MSLDNAPFKLSQILDSVAGLLALKAVEKHLILRLEPLPPSCNRLLTGDSLRLGQILINLVGNAIKFTERGEVEVDVCVLDESENDILLRFTVRDTGIGISDQDQKRLFSAFEQADNSMTRKYGAQAVLMANERRYVVILMDMQMPVMNGLEATQAIRANGINHNTPILAMTANAFPEDRQCCIEAGMNDHIGKPVIPELLFAKLLYWLDASKKPKG